MSLRELWRRLEALRPGEPKRQFEIDTRLGPSSELEHARGAHSGARQADCWFCAIGSEPTAREVEELEALDAAEREKSPVMFTA